MGTAYHIKLILPADKGSVAAATPSELQSGIEALLDKLDYSMSTYKPNSELNRLNRSLPGETFALSPELYEVLDLSRQVYDMTGGAFDPSVGPLVDLWGFGPQVFANRVPADAEILALRQRSGFDKIELDTSGATATRTSEIALDLSAIAKGYAVDEIAEFLMARGISDFLVEVGGELRLSGRNAQGELWKVAVERPQLVQGDIHSVLVLTDRGLATSGDYRNYFEQDGQRYSHTIDPRTGYPTSHQLASVTVIARTAAQADGLATGFLVLGKDETLRIAEANKIAVFLLVKDTAAGGASAFKAYYTSAFKPYLLDSSDD